jgi:hypothetical protein
VLLLLDRDTQRVYRLHGFTKSHDLMPGQAYCVVGKINSADKRYLVIESVGPTASTPGPPRFQIRLTAREVIPWSKPPPVPNNLKVRLRHKRRSYAPV